MGSWVKVGGAMAITSWVTPGQTETGIYRGLREGRDFGNGRSTLAVLELADGSTKSVGAPTALRGDLQNVPVGSKVQITYVGMQRNQKTGREFKAFETQVYRDDAGDAAPGTAPGTAPTVSYLVANVPGLAPSGLGPEFDALAVKFAAARGVSAARANIDAIIQLDKDPAKALDRLRKTCQANGVAV